MSNTVIELDSSLTVTSFPLVHGSYLRGSLILSATWENIRGAGVFLTLCDDFRDPATIYVNEPWMAFDEITRELDYRNF